MVGMIVGFAVSFAAWVPQEAASGPPSGVTRVEEDWEMVVLEPDVNVYGPQATTTMSPVTDARVLAVTLNMNYRDDPFQGGGMQLRLWVGNRVILGQSEQTAVLATPGERITWTQMLDVTDGALTIQVKNGSSTTWGNFGQDDNFKLVVSTSIANLDGYRVSESVANSGCGWQSNRVSGMRLLRVRYYVGDTLVFTDESPRSIVTGGS